MRILVFLLGLSVSGCAAVLDRAIGTQTAVSKLRTDLGADIDLRAALQKDIAIKNAELVYVSAAGYSCGPSTAEFATLTDLDYAKPNPKQDAERKKLRINFLKRNYGDLAAILKYGDSLDQIIKGQSDGTTTINDFRTFADNLNSIVPQQFQVVLGALSRMAGIAGAIYKREKQLELIQLAQGAQKDLHDAFDRIVKSGVHKAMTATERRMFYNWDSCAIDRLSFLRAYSPGSPAYMTGDRNEIARKTLGETRSPVLDFVAIQRKYIEEKEAFLLVGQTDIGESLTLEEARRKLGLTWLVVGRLVRHGHLKVIKVQSGLRNRSRALIHPDTLAAFQEAYVSASEIAAESDTHVRTLVPRLDRDGIKPAFDKAQVGQYFYRRADLKRRRAG